MKTCNQCKKEQPLENFHKSLDTSDGYSKICRMCEMDKNRKDKNREFKSYTGDCCWKDQECAEGVQ